MSAPIFPANRGCSCRTSAASEYTGKNARKSLPAVTRDSIWRLPQPRRRIRKVHTMFRATLLSLTIATVALHAQTVDGAAVYAQHCARCHEMDKTGWTPKRDILARMTPEAVLGSLHLGFM